jgi:hypothetical protein
MLHQGFKRCVECEIFLECGGVRCPCCNHILRIKPHNNVSKGKLLQDLNYIFLTNINSKNALESAGNNIDNHFSFFIASNMWNRTRF